MRFLLFFLATALTFANNVVNDVRSAIAHDQFARAAEIIRAYRTSNGVTPEIAESLSWMARGALERKNLVDAEKYAQEAYKLSQEQLKTHKLATDPNLQIALGASIEVEAIILTTRGQRAEAVTYLRDQLKAYYASPIRARIQKNINLLSLEGKHAPALEGITIPNGKPAIIFFWAHWCSDCKYESPILGRIKAEFAPKGLVLIAPTQKYGYVANGEDAPPEVELKYIDQVRRQYYADVIDAPAPVSEENFNKYGASTTPTFVFVDRAGIVRSYHPGGLTYEEMRALADRITK